MMPRGREVDGYDIEDEMDRMILPLMDVDVPRFRMLDGAPEDGMVRKR